MIDFVSLYQVLWFHSLPPHGGLLELDNNRSERAIKPFVIGRKNWMDFSRIFKKDTGETFTEFVKKQKLGRINRRRKVDLCQPRSQGQIVGVGNPGTASVE